jgi:hypothetical protein
VIAFLQVFLPAPFMHFSPMHATMFQNFFMNWHCYLLDPCHCKPLHCK